MPDTRAAVVAAAHALLAELIRSADAPQLQSLTVTAEGWSVTVSAGPIPAAAEQYTPCERDIIALLASAGKRLTTTDVISELDREGILHGESTIKHALAELVRRKKLTASRRPPRGYSLAS